VAENASERDRSLVPVRALFVGLGDHRLGHFWRVANHRHEFVRLVPKLAMGTTEPTGNRPDVEPHIRPNKRHCKRPRTRVLRALQRRFTIDVAPPQRLLPAATTIDCTSPKYPRCLPMPVPRDKCVLAAQPGRAKSPPALYRLPEIQAAGITACTLLRSFMRPIQASMLGVAASKAWPSGVARR
jgi:hypothetical protein